MSQGQLESWDVVRGQVPILEALCVVRGRLVEARLRHVFVDNVAMLAYGSTRVTNKITVCVGADDHQPAARALAGAGVRDELHRRWRLRVLDTVLILHTSADPVECSRGLTDVQFPAPHEASWKSGVPVPTLSRLIELKLVTWRLKVWADVIELIRANGLDEGFVDKLHPVARAAYLQCFDQMKEEDKYNAIHEP